MWIFTSFGFFSVVQKKNDTELTVRARSAQDLDNLREKFVPNLSETVTGQGTDYPYRARISHKDCAAGMAKIAQDIHYSNFKNEVAAQMGSERAHVYHKIWSDLLEIQKSEKPQKITTKKSSGYAQSFGGVVIDAYGRFLLRKPKDCFDGYVWTFPKGRTNSGESGEETALREVAEETGIKGEIIQRIPGTFKGGTTENTYYLIRFIENTGRINSSETEEIWWATQEEAKSMISMTTNKVGRERDLQVLQAAVEVARITGVIHPVDAREQDRKKQADLERVAGCLLGGAVGDALGAPVEFMSLAEIRKQFGQEGIRSYAPAYGRIGAITDDTQMTLFTAEGLLRAEMRGIHKGICSIEGVLCHAYLRWLATQDKTVCDPKLAPQGNLFPLEPDGWLYSQKELHSRRAPGNSCLSALRSGKCGTIDRPVNNSKGCGGVMRVAPVGLVRCNDPFETGCIAAAITHGHPTGYLAAGFFAQMIAEIFKGTDLESSIHRAREILTQWPSHQECLRAVDAALVLARESDPTPENVEKLGAGWVAEEALAISIFCALKAKDFSHGICLAVNHIGDSDSTGVITGNILGALLGRAAIPQEYLQDLELRSVIEELSYDLVYCDFDFDSYWDKYPGW